MTEDFQHLLDLLVASVDRRDAILPREQVQVRREVLEKRRQLEPLAQPLFAQLVVTHPRGDARNEHIGLNAMVANDGNRDALALLEDRREEIGRFNRLPSSATRLVEGELEDKLGRRRHAELAPREGRQHVQVLFERLQNLEVAHHL